MVLNASPRHERLVEGSADRISLSHLLQWINQRNRGSENVSIPAGNAPASKILSLLTSSGYRKGSLRHMGFEECRQAMLAPVERCVEIGKPVQVTLMAFPFKVPNSVKVGPRTLPDLAELAAIVRFCRLNSKVKAFYGPGLQVHIIHDGSYIADIFGVTLNEVRHYETCLADLIRAAGAHDFIQSHDFLSLFSKHASDVEKREEYLWENTLKWWQEKRNTAEWIDRFAKTVGMINLRDLPISLVSQLMAQARHGQLPVEYREIERRVHDAMLKYHLRDSLLHYFDPRPKCFPDAIHATTQERPGRLALWLIRRGRSQLPWHGVGMVDQGGRPGVALAERVMSNSSYRPVFIEHEETPFLYLETKSN